MNLPGVVVDLPTLTKKDEDDLVNWGVPNDIDFIAASFVRKGQDLDNIRKVLPATKSSFSSSKDGSELMMHRKCTSGTMLQSCDAIFKRPPCSACIATIRS